MKKKSNLSKKDKKIYNGVLGSLFLLVLIYIYWENDIFKLLHKNAGFSAIIQMDNFLYLSYFFSIIWVIYVFFMYSKTYEKCVPIKSLKKEIRNKKISMFFIPIVLIFTTMLFGVFSYSNYYYIENGNYYVSNFSKSQELFSNNDVSELDLSIVDETHSVSGKGIMVQDYYIKCVAKTKNGIYSFYSSDFYGYEALYNFVSKTDNVKISDITLYSKLLENMNAKYYLNNEQKNKDLHYVEKIFETVNTEG